MLGDEEGREMRRGEKLEVGEKCEKENEGQRNKLIKDVVELGKGERQTERKEDRDRERKNNNEIEKRK